MTHQPDGPAQPHDNARRRMSSTHPAVLAAARRAGLDPDTYVASREAERPWPASQAS